MQQVELTPTGEFFITQSNTGTAAGLYTTVITRFPGTAGASATEELDAMVIVDGGHGLGLHIEVGPGGRKYVWASLQGDVQQGDPTGGRLARFRYTPGTFTIDAIPGGVWFARQFKNAYGEYQESIYNFDAAEGYVVERMYDFHTNHQERFTRRRITDLLLGIDRPLGRLVLPVNPPTLQGFATMNSTFFRWCGLSNAGSGSPVPTDPMSLEQYDWTTGARIATRSFPTLGQTGGAWRDGAYEPEGCSVYREPDGTASLLVGLNTGLPGDHESLVSKFPSIGAA
jgi:hypothetical protein